MCQTTEKKKGNYTGVAIRAVTKRISQISPLHTVHVKVTTGKHFNSKLYKGILWVDGLRPCYCPSYSTTAMSHLKMRECALTLKENIFNTVEYDDVSLGICSNVWRMSKTHSSWIFSPLKLRALGCLETSRTSYPVSQCHIPEQRTLHQHHCEHLKKTRILTKKKPRGDFQPIFRVPKDRLWRHVVGWKRSNV